MSNKGLVASITKCLAQLLEQDDLNADARESLEVSLQCLESAYGVQASDAPSNFDIYSLYKAAVVESPIRPENNAYVSVEAKQAADRLKGEGNAALKCERYQEALDCYTKAIQLDGTNAVFYCNRAAAYSKIGNHQQAIKDCRTALSIDPNYSKAYGRLGLAYSSLDRYKEAKENYQKALQLEPDNESFKTNLQIAEEKLAQQGLGNIDIGNAGFSNMDFSSILSNPALMSMARQMLSDPNMQNMMSSIMAGNIQESGGRGLESLFQAGQQLAQQMQSSNPDLIENLRQQMGGNPNDPPNPNDVKKE